jgi:HD-like signal output (HDOD) protein
VALFSAPRPGGVKDPSFSADNRITAGALPNSAQQTTGGADGGTAAEARRGIRALLQDVRELPASALVLQGVLANIEDPDVTNHDVEDLLVRDPAVTAGVLRLANSAFFGVPSQIRTLNTAVRIVGRRRLKTLLRHLLVGQLFEVLAARSPELARVRNEALAAGVVCAEIGASLSGLEAEEFRIGGLLHNIGEFVIAARYPEIYRQYLGWCASMGREQAAQAAVGASFEEAGAILLENWSFPVVYVDGTRCQARPLQAPEESQRLAIAMLVGKTLSCAWQDGVAATAASGPLEQSLLDYLGMDKADCERIYFDIGAGVDGLKALLKPTVRQ